MPSTLLKHYADFWGFFDRDKTHLHPNKHEFTHNLVNRKEKPSSPFWFILSGPVHQIIDIIQTTQDQIGHARDQWGCNKEGCAANS